MSEEQGFDGKDWVAVMRRKGNVMGRVGPSISGVTVEMKDTFPGSELRLGLFYALIGGIDRKEGRLNTHIPGPP